MLQRAPLHTFYERIEDRVMIVVIDGDHHWAYFFNYRDYDALDEVWTRQKEEKSVPVKVIESAAVAAFFELLDQEQAEYLPYDTPAVV
jgi:hypothetical protein